MHPAAILALFISDAYANSPFVVPVAGCAMILGIVVASMWSGVRNREIQSRERLEAIARGVALPPTVEELALLHGKPTGSQVRRRANIRLAGIILLCGAGGLIAFFVVLAIVVQVREVLSGAAAALIPLALGIGFLLDTRIQSHEIDETSAGGTDAPASDSILR